MVTQGIDYRLILEMSSAETELMNHIKYDINKQISLCNVKEVKDFYECNYRIIEMNQVVSSPGSLALDIRTPTNQAEYMPFSKKTEKINKKICPITRKL